MVLRERRERAGQLRLARFPSPRDEEASGDTDADEQEDWERVISLCSRVKVCTYR
jgi:hypothetical protein